MSLYRPSQYKTSSLNNSLVLTFLPLRFIAVFAGCSFSLHAVDSQSTSTLFLIRADTVKLLQFTKTSKEGSKEGSAGNWKLFRITENAIETRNHSVDIIEPQTGEIVHYWYSTNQTRNGANNQQILPVQTLLLHMHPSVHRKCLCTSVSRLVISRGFYTTWRRIVMTVITVPGVHHVLRLIQRSSGSIQPESIMKCPFPNNGSMKCILQFWIQRRSVPAVCIKQILLRTFCKLLLSCK